jgi:hypothetical protein
MENGSTETRISAWSGWIVAAALLVMGFFGWSAHRDSMAEQQAMHKESMAVIERQAEQNNKVHHQQFLANNRALKHTLEALHELKAILKK